MYWINDDLLALMQKRNVDCVIDGDWLDCSHGALRASAIVARDTIVSKETAVQVDVRFQFVPEAGTILESFAGTGCSVEAATAEALHTFEMGCLPVIRKALPGAGAERVSEEVWLAGGVKRPAFIGRPFVKGVIPGQGVLINRFLSHLRSNLAERVLGQETHWVRLYYGAIPSGARACEVLLDNEPWGELQREAAALDWPQTANFYSARLFILLPRSQGEVPRLQPADLRSSVQLAAYLSAPKPQENRLTAADAVALLLEMVKADRTVTEQDVRGEFVRRGISQALSDRAFLFTQIAWGRMLLGGLGIRFSPEFVSFHAEGQVTETGKLSDEPCFVAACQDELQIAKTALFQSLALSSMDAQLVSQAMNAGAPPCEIILASSCLLWEELTPTGKERVEKFIKKQATDLTS